MGWEYVVVLIISAIIAVALQPKPPRPKPPSLQDLDVPTTEQGRELPWVFGEWLHRDPNCVWWGDLYTTAIKKKAGK